MISYDICLSLSDLGLPWWLRAKESAYNAADAEDVGSIPGSERFTGEGIGYPLRYSNIEISMDCVVHGVAKIRYD